MKEQSWLEEGWFFHNHAWHLLHEIIKQIPRESEFFLDVGAGTGIAASIIKAIFPHMDCFVTDIEEESKEFWINRGITGVVTKDIRLPFPDNQFDFTMSSHVLEHLNESEVIAMIQEIYRVTKHRIILAVPDGDVHFYDHKTIFNRTIFENLIRFALGGSNYNLITYPLYHPHINNLISIIDKKEG